LGVVLAGAYGYGFYRRYRLQQERLDQGQTTVAGRANLGRAGGEWELVDHTGVPRSSKDYVGRWLLVYFGFTHCPDICPDMLDKMSEVIETLASDATMPSLTPLFVTIDPGRDGVQEVAKYVADFPRLTGLTGTFSQVEDVAKKFNVYYAEGPRDQDGDYIIDHTIMMYLMDPDGEYVYHYGQAQSAEKIVQSIRTRVERWTEANAADKKK